MCKEGEMIQFESFELSPCNAAIIGTIGRLKHKFPVPTLAMDIESFNGSSFIDTIASTLGKMSQQSTAGTKSKTCKAGQMHDEDWDTSTWGQSLSY